MDNRPVATRALLLAVLLAAAARGDVATVWLRTGAEAPPGPSDPPPRAWVPPAPARPAVDGKLDEKAWTQAAVLSMSRLDADGQPACRSEVLLLRDAETLYVGFRLEEPYVGRMLRKVAKADGPIWQDDSAEVFLQPEGRRDYAHIAVSAAGALGDAKGGSARWSSGAKAAVDIQKVSWSAEIAVPLNRIVGGKEIPTKWRANFNRARYASGVAEDLAWAPTFSHTSHLPERFGHLSLAEKNPFSEAGRPPPAKPGGIVITRRQDGTAHLALNLAAIPRDAHIYRASLRAKTQRPPMYFDNRIYLRRTFMDPLNLWSRATPARPVEIYALRTSSPGGQRYEPKRLTAEPPRYRSFDATSLLRDLAGSKAMRGGLWVKQFQYWVPDETVLEVRYEGKVANPPPQAQNLRVTHRKGQTFVTWTEIDRLITDANVHWPDFRAAFERGSPRGTVLYRIYRSEKPITAANLHQAALIDEVGPLSGYDARVYQHRVAGEVWKGLDPMVIVPRYVIDDTEPGAFQANSEYVDGRRRLPEWIGRQLPLHTGLYVHQPRRSGRGYYAVTACVNGVENTRDFAAANSLPEPVEELVGAGEPILYRRLDNTRVQGRERNVRESQFYVYWAAPPYSNLPNYPIHLVLCVEGPDRLEPRTLKLRWGTDGMYYSELLHGQHDRGWTGRPHIAMIVYCEAPHDGQSYSSAYYTFKGSGRSELYVRRLTEMLLEHVKGRWTLESEGVPE